jgi:hypothetical protein
MRTEQSARVHDAKRPHPHHTEAVDCLSILLFHLSELEQLAVDLIEQLYVFRSYPSFAVYLGKCVSAEVQIRETKRILKRGLVKLQTAYGTAQYPLEIESITRFCNSEEIVCNKIEKSLTHIKQKVQSRLQRLL